MKHFTTEKPKTETELLERAKFIAGLSIKELASEDYLNVPLISSLKENKGFIGQLIEKALGASDNGNSNQDFPELGIELKTIPVDPTTYKPVETTFLTNINLTDLIGVNWNNSLLKQKISKILFIPITRTKIKNNETSIPFYDEVIGNPILWTLDHNPIYSKLLEKDFEELLDEIVLGNVKTLTAKTGEYLQIRGKSSKTLVNAYDKNGNLIKIPPLAFYFKTNLTSMIINDFLNKSYKN